jgi:hypothetical protein
MSHKKANDPTSQQTSNLEPDLSSAETYHQGDGYKHAHGDGRLDFEDNGGEVWPASAGYGVETVMPRVSQDLVCPLHELSQELIGDFASTSLPRRRNLP